MELPCSEIIRWGGWYVLQVDPAMHPWKIPDKGYSRSDNGIVHCDKFAARFKHVLDWPSDAYYFIQHNDETLWAWTDKHLQIFSQFIQSKNRKPENYKGYYLFLRHVPKIFLVRSNEKAIVKKIDKILRK